MYQKEFAMRMYAKVGTKNYSRLSAMLFFKSSIEFLTDVSSESFIPKPKIDSSVVKLTPVDFNISDGDFSIYSSYTKAFFQHKNKKARNALIDSRHVISSLDKKEFRTILNDISNEEINDLLNKRVITLNPNEILYLSKFLNDLYV